LTLLRAGLRRDTPGENEVDLRFLKNEDVCIDHVNWEASGEKQCMGV
jgi:hypothetical protein